MLSFPCRAAWFGCPDTIHKRALIDRSGGCVPGCPGLSTCLATALSIWLYPDHYACLTEIVPWLYGTQAGPVLSLPLQLFFCCSQQRKTTSCLWALVVRPGRSSVPDTNLHLPSSVSVRMESMPRTCLNEEWKDRHK